MLNVFLTEYYAIINTEVSCPKSIRHSSNLSGLKIEFFLGFLEFCDLLDFLHKGPPKKEKTTVRNLYRLFSFNRDSLQL